MPSNKKSIEQAVILSGGKGERLMPFTKTVNKGMVPIAGKPFLEHLIELSKRNGIRRFLILTGHAKESITSYFGNGRKFGVEITYRYSPPEFNHGKRFAEALTLIDDFFLLIRNDIYWPFDLKKHLKHFEKQGLPALMTVYINKNKDGIYGPNNNIHINESGHIERYDNLLSPDPFYSGQDLGFFIFKKQAVLDNLPKNVPSQYCLHHEFLSGLAKKGLLTSFQTEFPATTTTDASWLKKTTEYFAALENKT